MSLSLYFHRFTTRSEVAALLTLVGPRLTKLHLMLEGRGQAANDPQGANNDTQVILGIHIELFLIFSLFSTSC